MTYGHFEANAASSAIVVGLGAMGSALAYHLARRGVRVVGLDRYVPPHDRGSSHGESRIIREAYFEDPRYVPLVQRSYSAWRELEEESGQRLLTPTGALVLGAPTGKIVSGAMRSAREHGIPHRLLDVDEVGREFPEIRPRVGEVGVYEERAGVLDPDACIRAHLRGAAAYGADLRMGEEMVAWEPGVRVTTRTRRYEADAVVLAMGSWLPGVAPEIGLQVERQVMLWFEPAARPESFSPGCFPVFLWEAPEGLFYGVPDLGSGVKAAGHHGGETSSHPADLTADPTPADEAHVRRFLEDRVPAAAGPLRSSAVCRYTNTGDGHFLIDRYPRQPGVWVASACSGHGFKFTAALGAVLAGEIASGRPSPDLQMFRWRTAV